MAIHVSERAAQRIREVLRREGILEGGLRIGVKGGGCSGLSYVMQYETEKRPGDKVFEENGVKLFVDLKSYLYLNGTTLDWQDKLIESGFTFINPNAARTCGCGSSFSA
ncbi:MAG: iron-sulfur cluster assembly accessory protein [Acidobacteria bacterium]|nr:iron-sulfur cluster assembly accessory protein [Acidobacteriota bacterium]